MKTKVGVWIDHRQAVIVTLVDHVEEIKRIPSDIEKHVRYSGASHSQTATGHDDSAEDRRDRRFDDRLSRYYDEIIAYLRDADSILIFGPGEAKGELQKQLEGHALGERIVGIETTDKMSDEQVATKVREYFRG
jgi:hypothetical protein